MTTTEPKSKAILSALILSVFGDEGPAPYVSIPENNLDYTNQMVVAMKTISLLMGEQAYQNSDSSSFESLKYFGILPFPDINLTGLTYFFLIRDDKARGKANASTISILVPEAYHNLLYENMKQLSVFLADAAAKISQYCNPKLAQETIQNLYDKLSEYVNNIDTHVETKRKLKILFCGLDSCGKTSFLRAIKQKYSELMGISATKKITRTEQVILGTTVYEWDVPGQSQLRKDFLEGADFYLFDTNLLFYLVDVRDFRRYQEALDFFSQIMRKFRSFNQNPPIVINFHKFDPDIAKTPEMRQNIEFLKQNFTEIAESFKLSFFETTIFDNYTLIKSFSEGIGLISPNRAIFEKQLEWLAHQINAQSVLLINDNSIIISDYSIDENTSRVSEMSAPHFQMLFRTFTEFKLLRHNNAIWNMEEEVIIFFKLKTEEIDQTLYLLCLTKNKDDIIKQLEKFLPEFIDRTKSLIKTYL